MFDTLTHRVVCLQHIHVHRYTQVSFGLLHVTVLQEPIRGCQVCLTATAHLINAKDLFAPLALTNVVPKACLLCKDPASCLCTVSDWAPQVMQWSLCLHQRRRCWTGISRICNNSGLTTSTQPVDLTPEALFVHPTPTH